MFEKILKQIAITAMTGKGAEGNKDLLAELCVKAVKQIRDDDGNIDLDNVKIEKKQGSGINDTELVQGVLIDKEKVHSGMPRIIKNAKIALLDCALEIKSPETDTKIQINSPDQLQGFLEQEEKLLRNMVDKVIKSKANVVICQKGIDDVAQHYLAKAKIYAARRVKKSDMDKLARATNAKVISNLNDLSEEDLGSAGIVEEVKVGDEMMTFVKECTNPKAVTILVRGGSNHVIDEIERAIKDALGDISASLKSGKVVGGAGSIEIEVSNNLRKYANTLGGKEQLAVNAFADAMEIIPRTLAENAGLDPIDILTELKSSHSQGNKWHGVDVNKGKLMDAWSNGVIEPLKIKTQAVKSASEVSELILRIDDVIAAGGSKDRMPSMPQGYPGME